jgi:hypothetical protein
MPFARGPGQKRHVQAGQLRGGLHRIVSRAQRIQNSSTLKEYRVISEVPIVGNNLRRRIPNQPSKHVCEVVTKYIRRLGHLDQFVGVFVPHQHQSGGMPTQVTLGLVTFDPPSNFHKSKQVVEHVAQLVLLPFEAIGLTEAPERGIKRTPDSRITVSESHSGTVPQRLMDGTAPRQITSPTTPLRELCGSHRIAH